MPEWPVPATDKMNLKGVPVPAPPLWRPAHNTNPATEHTSAPATNI
jgi:hypothetical protein